MLHVNKIYSKGHIVRHPTILYFHVCALKKKMLITTHGFNCLLF